MTRIPGVEKEITSKADAVDWDWVSREVDIFNFSDEFFETFRNELTWAYFELNEINSVFYEKYKDLLPFTCHYENGMLHRLDGPAFYTKKKFCHKKEKWYKKGELHRDGGPAVILHAEQMHEEHWVNGVKHRGNGPAVYHNSGHSGPSYEYWVNGKLHREDGPAKYYEYRDTDTWNEYWIDGIKVSKLL